MKAYWQAMLRGTHDAKPPSAVLVGIASQTLKSTQFHCVAARPTDAFTKQDFRLAQPHTVDQLDFSQAHFENSKQTKFAFYRFLVRVSKDISISVPSESFSFERTFAGKAMKCVPSPFGNNDVGQLELTTFADIAMYPK